MTSRNSRRTWSRGAVLATAGALAVGLLPAAAANAGPSTPVFSYVDASGGTVTAPTRQLAVDDVFGSSPASLTPSTNLTASNYQTYAHDVSPDGSTLLYAGRTGSPTSSAYDSTFGVVVVHTGATPADTTSRLLTTFWQVNPVLSDNGTRAWFLSGGKLYKADTVTGAVTLANATAFAPAKTESLVRLAVSPDGTTAAVQYAPTGTNKTARVLVAPVATGKTTTNYAEVLYPTNVAPKKTLKPNSSTFVFQDSSTLVYGQYDTATPKTVNNVSLTLNGATKVTVPATHPTLDNFYDLRQDAGGTWWMWKDAGTGPATTSTAYSSPAADLFTVAPTAFGGDRGNGSTTYGYVPSAVNPPALADSSNRAVSHLTFGFAASTAHYAQRVAYQSYNLYGGLVAGGYSPSSPAEVDRGELWSSTDGVTYKKLLTTSGASAFVLGSKWFNGYTPKLARNTWFTWRFAGDAFVAPASTSVRRIIVIPNVSAHAASNGASWIVSGAVTRIGGSAVLYRVVSGKLVKVASTPIVAKGAYTFGKRHLARGTYRVVSPADKSWGGAYKQFSF